jgi:hypothetical protein
MEHPFLSMIVVLYNMRREAQRTLHALSAAYQLDVRPEEYDVHVVENGSADPVGEEFVHSFGANFHYHYLKNPPPSPTYALNYGAAHSKGRFVGIMIDGAHILTPRVVSYAKKLAGALPCPVVAVQRFYLGPGQQPDTVQTGYCREVEDELLEGIGWPREPYRLFEIAAFARATHRGWFSLLWESNCLMMPRTVWDGIGGCDERFDFPGGGFANLDLYAQSVPYPGAELLMLLGEGSFHQVHGGTMNNAPPVVGETQLYRYREQYREIRGRDFHVPKVHVEYFGSLHPHSFLV